MPIQQKLSVLLRRRLRELRKLMDAVHRRCDIKSVHNLRVHTRRLRSMAWLADRWLGSGTSRAFRRELQRLGRTLGPCRALDVAAEDADALLLPSLVELRTRESLKVRKAAARRRALEWGERLVRKLERSDSSRVETDRFVRLLSARPGAKSNKNVWHEYRIEVKKCRYVLETLHHLGLVRDRPHERLRKVQSALGRAHDLEVLRQFTRRLSPGRPSPWLRPLEREERSKILEAIRLARQAAPQAQRALSRVARRFEVPS